MIISVLIFFLGVIPLSADQAEPEEPDIILPEVILLIEDLSVDIIEAGLPGEDELLPLKREIPLPEKEELRIEDPVLPPGLTESEPFLTAEPDRSLSAEAVLGAGSMNHIYSMISLYRAGEEPRFTLKFLHEMLDGFAGHSPGSGYNFRRDSLQGGAKFHLKDLKLEARGSVEDIERGLQQNGPFFSRVFRQGAADIDLLYPFGEIFSLGGRVETFFSSSLLTGENPDPDSEIVISPELSARFEWEKFWFGLNSRYKYRNLMEEEENPLHRLAVKGLMGLEFGSDLKLEGTGGWFYNSLLGSLFPFELVLSGTPFSSFTFRASGGYRVDELDFHHILRDYPLAGLPDTLLDNHGWFGDLGFSFSFIKNLSFQTRAVLSSGSAMVEPDGLNTKTGLFSLDQEEGIRLSASVGMRMNLLNILGLSAGLESELLEYPELMPRHRLKLEMDVEEISGRWGARSALLFNLDHDILIPLLDISGYYKITDIITLIAECNDLLYPCIKGPRYSWNPFEEPGLRATFKIQIRL